MQGATSSQSQYSNAAGQLVEDPAGFLRVVWNPGARRLSETQALFTTMRYTLRRHNWSRILIDQSRMRPFSAEEQQWLTQEWLPQAVQAGYRHGAIVVSPQVMVRLATAYVTTHIRNLPLTYRSFETEAEARAWLLLQPAAPEA